jgi:hypothetical protein
VMNAASDGFGNIAVKTTNNPMVNSRRDNIRTPREPQKTSVLISRFFDLQHKIRQVRVEGDFS